MQQLPASVKKLWRISGLATGVVLGLVLSGFVSGAVMATEMPTPVFGLGALAFLGPVVVGIWWAGVKYRNWGWQITDQWIEAKYGVVGHHRVIIPRNRVQTVTTNSGPIDRMLDLETITVHTAGAGAPNLTIPHLDTATVVAIRTELGQGVDDRRTDQPPVADELTASPSSIIPEPSSLPDSSANTPFSPPPAGPPPSTTPMQPPTEFPPQ